MGRLQSSGRLYELSKLMGHVLLTRLILIGRDDPPGRLPRVLTTNEPHG